MLIEIKKRYAFAIMLILSVGLVVAYGGSSPSSFGHSAGEVEGTVPSGFCIFSATQNSCPAGFQVASKFYTDANGNYVPGALRAINPGDTSKGAVGDQGGKEVHNHANSNWRSQTSGAAGGNRPESNWPPYTNVLVCCKA